MDADAADLKGKQAQVTQQAALVAKKTMRAPFAGRLGITTVNPGQYLNPGDKIVTLQAIDPIYVDFFVPQQQVAGLSVGQSLTLSTDAYPSVAFAGKIRRRSIPRSIRPRATSRSRPPSPIPSGS